MPLMERMRGFTKVILYLLVLAFVGTIIFDWGMDFTGLSRNPNLAGKVNGQEIHIDEYWRAYQQELTNYQQRYGAEPSESQVEFIQNQVWEAMVQNLLVRQEIKKRGIKATDDEIYFYLTENPPDFITGDTLFHNEFGQFDRSKYQAALQSPQNDMVWKNIEDYLREVLPMQKFQDYFTTTVYVTESEVRREYLKRHQQATVEYLFFDPARFSTASLQVAEEEVKAHYQKKKDEYKQPERRKIEYVFYSTRPTAADSAEVFKRAETIMERLQAGDDFDELARLYSEDVSNAERGGDLNFFREGDMVKPFEDAAFAAEIGEIVGPIETNFGVHVIKVTDRKIEDGAPQVRASHILLKYEASSKTKNAAFDDAEFFAEIAKKDGWKRAVEESGDTPQTSPLFQEGSGFVPGLGIERNVSRFIFRNKVGDISETLETQNGYVVVRITEKEDEKTKPLEEVRGLIENELLQEKRMELAGQMAARVREGLNGGTTFEAVAATDSLPHVTTQPFTRNAFVPEVGRDPVFAGTSFALPPNSISQPIKGVKGYYLLRVLSRTEFNEQDYELKKAGIRAELERRKEQQSFANWYADLKDRAKIEDYRRQYF